MYWVGHVTVEKNTSSCDLWRTNCHGHTVSKLLSAYFWPFCPAMSCYWWLTSFYPSFFGHFHCCLLMDGSHFILQMSRRTNSYIEYGNCPADLHEQGFTSKHVLKTRHLSLLCYILLSKIHLNSIHIWIVFKHYILIYVWHAADISTTQTHLVLLWSTACGLSIY